MDKCVSHGSAIDAFFWRELDAAGMAKRTNPGTGLDAFFRIDPDAAVAWIEG